MKSPPTVHAEVSTRLLEQLAIFFLLACRTFRLTPSRWDCGFSGFRLIGVVVGG